MTGRRSKYEIWAQCLEACTRAPHTQSWLLRKLRLKTSAVKRVLDFLEGAGLIRGRENAETGNIEYGTTDHGEEALAKYYELVTQYFIKDAPQ